MLLDTVLFGLILCSTSISCFAIGYATGHELGQRESDFPIKTQGVLDGTSRQDDCSRQPTQNQGQYKAYKTAPGFDGKEKQDKSVCL